MLKLSIAKKKKKKKQVQETTLNDFQKFLLFWKTVTIFCSSWAQVFVKKLVFLIYDREREAAINENFSQREFVAFQVK